MAAVTEPLLMGSLLPLRIKGAIPLCSSTALTSIEEPQIAEFQLLSRLNLLNRFMDIQEFFCLEIIATFLQMLSFISCKDCGLLIYILPFGTSTNNNDIDSDLEIQEAAV
jgi:hypothetical protein